MSFWSFIFEFRLSFVHLPYLTSPCVRYVSSFLLKQLIYQDIISSVSEVKNIGSLTQHTAVHNHQHYRLNTTNEHIYLLEVVYVAVWICINNWLFYTSWNNNDVQTLLTIIKNVIPLAKHLCDRHIIIMIHLVACIYFDTSCHALD